MKTTIEHRIKYIICVEEHYRGGIKMASNIERREKYAFL